MDSMPRPAKVKGSGRLSVRRTNASRAKKTFVSQHFSLAMVRRGHPRNIELALDIRVSLLP